MSWIPKLKTPQSKRGDRSYFCTGPKGKHFVRRFGDHQLLQTIDELKTDNLNVIQSLISSDHCISQSIVNNI